MGNVNEDSPLYRKYFYNNVYEDIDECLNVGDQAYEPIKIAFNMKIKDPDLMIVFYMLTFQTIQNKVLEQQRSKKSFKLNLAGYLEMGFDDLEDEEDEKQGNFMVFIRHLERKAKKFEPDPEEVSTVERATSWMAENVTTQIEFINDIEIEAAKLMRNEIKLVLEESVVIIPTFCFIHESLINYLKTKRHELGEFEFEINFANCFVAGARESADGEDEIYFRPNIESKLSFKSDRAASSIHE